MKAAEFNSSFKELVAKPLSSIGFKQSGRNLILRNELADIALIRCDGGQSALAQIARFIICFRHNFLRNLEQQLPKEFVETSNDYPFKIRLSQFAALSKWHYEPINLGIRNYDIITYGNIKSADAPLNNMVNTLQNYTSRWIEFLTPENALSQIKKFGENAYCEKIWIEDYEQFLSTYRVSS
jgi:hypothetical protein